MEKPSDRLNKTRYDAANRLFFRLYQCANLLHKTGTKAVQAEGLTTQQWAVMGALSRPTIANADDPGMNIGELAAYLMVSRQNLAGVISRMSLQGHLEVKSAKFNRRARRVSLSHSGMHVWTQLATPKIADYYDQALNKFSSDDLTHALHYLLRMLENMKAIETAQGEIIDTSDSND